jgi:hypothetical protein
MAQAANIIQYVQIGFGRQTQAYGAWYEGEQQEDYYKTQAGATQWEKNNLYRETEAAAERDIRAAGALQVEAKNAQYEVAAVKKAGAHIEKRTPGLRRSRRKWLKAAAPLITVPRWIF